MKNRRNSKTTKNIYAWGGFSNVVNSAGDKLFGEGAQTMMGLTKGGTQLTNMGVGALSSIAGGLINKDGQSTFAGDALNQVGSLASMIPGVGGIIGAGVGVLGSAVNAGFGSKINKQFVNQTEGSINEMFNTSFDYSSLDNLQSDWSNLDLLNNVSRKQVGKDGWFRSKAKRKARKLNNQIDNANSFALDTFDHSLGNYNTMNMFGQMSNTYADGGPINNLLQPKDNTNVSNPKLFAENQRRERQDNLNKNLENPNTFLRAWLGADGTRAVKEDNIRYNLKKSNIPELFNDPKTLAKRDQERLIRNYDNIREYSYDSSYPNSKIPTGEIEDSIEANMRKNGAKPNLKFPHKSNKKWTSPVAGYYDMFEDYVFYNEPYQKNSTVPIHEKTHASSLHREEQTIRNIMDDIIDNYGESALYDKDYRSPGMYKYGKKYHDLSWEIMAKLMESRYRNKLHPNNRNITDEQVQEFKKTGNRNFEKRYSEQFLDSLYNKVAYNSGDSNNNSIYNNMNNIQNNIFAQGGEINPTSNTHGAGFSTGVTKINSGGSHEDNPNQGVPIGMDQEGNPNLVEEGEVVFNDYVYSNRIEADKEFIESVNLDKKYIGKTYAFIADSISMEAEERPNDPISLNGLNANMGKLMAAQEMQKQQEEMNKMSEVFNQMQNLNEDDAQALATELGMMEQPQEQAMTEEMPMEEQMPIGELQEPAMEDPMLQGFARGGNLFAGGGPKKSVYDIVFGNDETPNSGMYSSQFDVFGNNSLAPTKNNNKVTTQFEPKVVPYKNRFGSERDFGALNRMYNPNRNANRPNDFLSTMYGDAGTNLLATRNNTMSNPTLGNSIMSATNFDLGNPTQAIGKGSSAGKMSGLANFRYAPILGSLTQNVSDMFNKPDYSEVDRIEKAIKPISKIRGQRLNDYMIYNPLDESYLMNK